MTKYPVIIIDLQKPVSGYWDGGAKSHFEFAPIDKTHTKGGKIQWGSHAANFKFMADAGGSWTDAGRIAKTALIKMLKPEGAKISVVMRG